VGAPAESRRPGASALWSLLGCCVLAASWLLVGRLFWGAVDAEAWTAVSADLDRWATLAGHTGSALAAAVGLGMPLAIALAIVLFRTDLPGRRGLIFVLVLAAALPVHVVSAAALAVVGAEALQGSALALGAVHALAHLPLVTLVCGLALSAVDGDLERSAATDGAGALGVLWRITLRGALGGLVAALLLLVLLTATDYSVSDVLLVRTFAEEVYTLFALHGRAAEPTLVALPMMALFGVVLWFLRRRFVSAAAAQPGRAAPHVFSLGRIRAPVALALWALILGLAGLPIARLWALVGGFSQLLASAQMFAPELLTSVACCTVAAALAAMLATPLAWSLARRPWASRLIALWLVIMLSLPAPLLGIGLVELLNRPGPLGALYDSPAVLVLTYLLRFLPVAVLLVYPAARAIPDELLHAARADGCDRGQLQSRLVSPLLRPAAVIAFLVTWLLAMGELPATLLVTPPGYTTAGARFFTLVHYGLAGEAAALSLLSALCTLVPAALLAALLLGRRRNARNPLPGTQAVHRGR